jgi:CRP-like cAMP-binding protein
LTRHIPSCAAGVPVFRVLSPDELEKIGKEMRHRVFRKGEVVVPAGSVVDCLYVVSRGRLNVVHTSASGREQVVRALGPGEFLGEMALFYDSVMEGDVVAAEETETCVLPRKAVAEILRNPEAALRLVEEMAKRLSAAEKLIADLGLREVGQRLAAELLRLAPSGQKKPEGIIVSVPVPWAEMAVRLGTTPETLSRRLGALADRGIIRQTGARTVLILDPERLKDVARQ